MKNTVFEYLNWRNTKSQSTIEERRFVEENRSLFIPAYRKYLLDTSSFGYLKAYVIILSLYNRKMIVDGIKKKDSSVFDSLPHFKWGDTEIYIPTYSPSVNKRLKTNQSSLSSYPYKSLLEDSSFALVDPFETYSNHVFSTFTNLKLIKSRDIDSLAFYHEGLETVFVIDDMGRLEISIPLFDERIKNKDKTNIIKRLNILMKNYYDNDRLSFIEHLLSLSLVSSELYEEIVELINKRQHDTERHLYK